MTSQSKSFGARMHAVLGDGQYDARETPLQPLLYKAQKAHYSVWLQW
jgi:hypothetical protein